VSTTIERDPEVVERPARRPPPLIHLFRPRWWEILLLPPRLWRVREGDITLCGLRCNWTSPRGHGRRATGEVCVVCRDLAGWST
jgi:hypothetical protein